MKLPTFLRVWPNGHQDVLVDLASVSAEPCAPLATIRARRDTLAAQLVQAQQQYAQMEATLHELDRQMCMMHGGVQALDALLSEAEDTCAPSPPPS